MADTSRAPAMNDLVERLRDLGDRAGYEPHMHHTAAAEITRLRTVLRDIADGMGETDIKQIGRFAPAVARAALGDDMGDT